MAALVAAALAVAALATAALATAALVAAVLATAALAAPAWLMAGWGGGGVGDGGVGDGGVGGGGAGGGGVGGADAAAACVTSTCCPLTMMAPSREAVLSLGATLNEMLPSPFPDAGDNAEIQLTAVEASHAHSGLAVTLKLPRPPPASTVGGEPNESSHFTAVGAVETLEEDPHPPVATAATTNSVATAEQ